MSSDLPHDTGTAPPARASPSQSVDQRAFPNSSDPSGTPDQQPPPQPVPRSRQRVTVASLQVNPKDSTIHRRLLRDEMKNSWTSINSAEDWLQACASAVDSQPLIDAAMTKYKDALKQYTSLFADPEPPASDQSSDAIPPSLADTVTSADKEADQVGDASTGGQKTRNQVEADIYESFVKAVDYILRDQSHGSLVCRDTSSWPESSLNSEGQSISIDDGKPDVGIYDEAARDSWERPEKRGVSPEAAHYTARVAWSELAIAAEFKLLPTSAPFHAPRASKKSKAQASANPEGSQTAPLLHDSKGGDASRAQLTRYGENCLRRQHRVHVFVLSIIRDQARLVRFDRAGAIVSGAIDLTKNPEPFINFLARFAAMSREERGYDTTVVSPAPEELAKLERYMNAEKTSAYAKKLVKDIWDAQRLYPIRKVFCDVLPTYYDPPSPGVGDTPSDPAQSGPPQPPEAASAELSQSSFDKSQAFLIGMPSFFSYSPTGRATKGFVAYDLLKDKLRYLKDAWRPFVKSTHPELGTYTRLQAFDVKCVATALGGGDVKHWPSGERVQVTLSHPTRPKGIERVHHRLLLQQVGRHLETCEHALDVVIALAAAVSGHQSAWRRAGVLHSDISTGNIMIDIETNMGFLTDWDLCKYKEDLTETSNEFGRSGTWPFLSALVLEYPFKPYDPWDDTESFIHVLSVEFVRRYPHDKLPSLDSDNRDLLIDFMYRLFWKHAMVAGYEVGGDTKHQHIELGQPPFQMENKHLAALMVSLYRLLQTHYKDIDSEIEQYKREWAAMKTPPTASDPAPTPSGPERKFSRLNRFQHDRTEDKEARSVLVAEQSKLQPERQAPKLLDPHATLLGVLEAWCDQMEALENNEWCVVAGPDQLKGLPKAPGAHVKGSATSKISHRGSTTRRTSTRTSTTNRKSQQSSNTDTSSGKHGRSDDGEVDEQRPKSRRKTLHTVPEGPVEEGPARE